MVKTDRKRPFERQAVVCGNFSASNSSGNGFFPVLRNHTTLVGFKSDRISQVKLKVDPAPGLGSSKVERDIRVVGLIMFKL